MSVRSTVLATALGLVCSLAPLTSIPADAPVADAATRLESLLTAHDVRNVIYAHDVRDVIHAHEVRDAIHAHEVRDAIHAHDVRDAIHAPRSSSSDCLHTETERGR